MNMSTHTVTCSSRWAQHDVVHNLRQRRIAVVVNDGLRYCDFVCGASSVLYYELHHAEAQREQTLIISRLEEARQRCGTQPVILMVWVTNPEPSLEVLTWLNLECGVAQQCGLLLVWSLDDVVQFLASLAASAVTSLEFSGGARQDTRGAPLPALIDALTQTPQIVTRNDVVRIANRKTCMADVLMSEAGDWEGIAGLGHKKAARLQHLFRTPFLSSQQTVESFVRSTAHSSAATLPAPLDAVDGSALAPSADLNSEAASLGKEEMMRALQRQREEEDNEDD